MYSQPELILEHYELAVSEIKKGRGNYICETSAGRKVLTAFPGSGERAEFLREVLSGLKEQGFAAEQIVLTREGSALAADEYGDRYLLKDLVEGEECSAKSLEQMRCAAESLGYLHRALNGLDIAIPDALCEEEHLPEVLARRHERELVKVKNYVKSRNRKNEFEMKFRNAYAHFAAQAAEACELLSECGPDEKGRALCHGDFNHHNIVRSGKNWQIVNYEKLCCGRQVGDFANFLRKMMEKNDWDLRLGSSLIRSYDRISPLGEQKMRQLYAMLLFPEKFWKLANHYYNTHKAWVSGRSIDKLDRVMAQEERRRRFLSEIARNVPAAGESNAG